MAAILEFLFREPFSWRSIVTIETASAAAVRLLVSMLVLGALSTSPLTGQDFLSGSEIRELLEGNTIVFKNARGSGDIYIYFKSGGQAEQKIGKHGMAQRKQWWIGDNSMLCRAAGPSNRESCRRVAITGNALNFYKEDGQSFKATLLLGRKLPD